MKALLIIAAALAGTGAAAQQVTVVANAPPVARVALADLDLSSEAGVRALDRRVSAAAHALCEEAGVHPLPVQLAQKRCFTTAQASGREQAARIVDSRRAGAALAGASVIVRASN